jgi:superfamily II DNA or RNA helicase
MPLINIHINEDHSYYELTGDTASLWANRRARFYMKDYLGAHMNPDQTINIRFIKESEEDRERVLIQIQDLLNKFSFSESLSSSSKNILSEFIAEKEKFDEFSIKAKEIWNNKLDAQEFQSFIKVLKEEVPNRKLFDLQLLAAYHLAFSQNACNFSVPGAGKTSVVYAAYAFLKSLSKDDKKYVNKLFIIGPLSSFGPWEDEYLACFGSKADVQRLSGGVSRDEKIRHFLSPHSAEITLISYQGIASSLDDIISYLRRYENRVMIVLDEAHKIKNTEGGIWAQSVLSLAKYCKSRVVLTGTPMPNGYEDVYNLYNFIWPEKNIIEYPLYQLKEMSQNDTDDRIPLLIDRMSPFFIRITKKDLEKYMGLPKAIENDPIYIKMGHAQREIYNFIENNYMDYFQNSFGSDHDPKNVLLRARMVRLMQAATDPSMLKKPMDEYYIENGVSNELFIDDSKIINKILNYKEVEIPEKFKAVYNLAKRLIENNEKVIIWGVFIQTIKQLQIYFINNGISSRLLIGETPIDNDNTQSNSVDTREGIIKEFNSNNSSFNVIIANPFAVAESISLHKACHNAIYMERNFNAANFIQSKDRIHRVGLQPNDRINYYYILSEDSIDETIHSRLKQKEARMLKIIESNEIPLISMNMDYESDVENDDIKALILDYVGRASKD